MNPLDANKYIGDFQFGFRRGKSCLSQMLMYNEEVTKYLEEGKIIDSIYLDMEKVFDRLDLGLLAHCMKENHIFGKLH